MSQKRTAVVTVDEVTYRQYRVISVYFTNAKSNSSAFHTLNSAPMPGDEVFKYVEKLAKENSYVLERNKDFGVDVPRILIQDVKNPGFFKVPYSL